MKAPLPPNEAARLSSLHALALLDSLPELEFDEIVKLASAICETPIALISLVDAERQWFKARVGISDTEGPREFAFCAHAILQSDVLVVHDARTDDRFSDNPAVTGEPNVRFYAGAPLLAPDGHALGTVCVADRVARTLTPAQEEALTILSHQVTRLLALRSKTRDLEEASARSAEREARLQKISDQLGESETRFRAAFEMAAVGLLVVSPEGKLLRANRAFAEMLGYQEDELTGVHVNDVTWPDDREGTRLRLLRNDGATIHVAKRFLHRDGSAIWTEVVGRRLTDEHGRFLYWISHVQNVTARNASEERLRAQYTMARLLAEAPSLDAAAPEVLRTLCKTGGWDYATIWELDELDDVLRCAAIAECGSTGIEAFRAFAEKLRFARGEGITGKTWASGHSNWIEKIGTNDPRSIVNEAIAPGIRSMFSVPILLDGQVIGVVDLVATIERLEDQEIRTLAEALCAQIGPFLHRKRSLEIQRRMATVLETTSDFVSITDREGRALFLNPAARLMLELPPEVDGRGLKLEHHSSHGTLPPAATTEWRWAGEMVYTARSGREIPVSQVTIAPRGPDGAPLYYASIARDISEAKKVERIKNEFVSTVSHELRTPLTSIRGALGLLEGGVVGALDADSLEIIKIARTNSDRLIRLINEMLDLDKIEAGKLELVIADVSAESLSRSALDSVRGMANENGILLEGAIEEGLQARVDVDRIVQVITNLLSNAVKFSPHGARVTLRAASTGARARFEVEDRGPGIPPELKARLFQKFQQLDSSDSRAKGGTGLGLAISKAIVEQMGGHIGVESAPGAGATFWFEVERAPTRRKTLPPPPQAPTVLIVEDHPDMRSLLVESLNPLGVRILEASDGAHGLHLARAERPQIIILDLGIPRPNGFEVVAILKSESSRATPLIIYSGRDLSAKERESLTLGETRFLTKTLSTEEDIVAAVRELLGRTSQSEKSLVRNSVPPGS